MFISSIKIYVRNLLQQNAMMKELVRGGVGVFILKLSNLLFGTLLAIVLARFLGPEGYGVYIYVFTLVSILAVPTLFGLPRLIVRETAKAEANEKWEIMVGVWRWAFMVAVMLSVIVNLFVFVFFYLISDTLSSLQIATFLWGMILMPLIVLGSLSGSALEGLRRVVLGRLSETVLRPACFIVLIFLLTIFSDVERINAATVMSLHVFAAGITFMVSIIFFLRRIPYPPDVKVKPIYMIKEWSVAVLPFALSSGMVHLTRYTDIVILGMFTTSKDVGIYRVAIQGGTLILFGLQIVTMLVSPYFVRMFTHQNYRQLRKLLILTVQISAGIAFVILLFFIFCGEKIIFIFFGNNYLEAYLPLVIISIGQFVNAVVGPVNILLLMTGFEQDTLRSLIITAFMNVLLNFLLIPLMGIQGAALATTLALIAWGVSIFTYGKIRFARIFSR